jgi:hypothetical protein
VTLPAIRRTPAQIREIRNIRIVAAFRAGAAYEDIGLREGLTPGRIRQIVTLWSEQGEAKPARAPLERREFSARY